MGPVVVRLGEETEVLEAVRLREETETGVLGTVGRRGGDLGGEGLLRSDKTELGPTDLVVGKAFLSVILKVRPISF